MINWNTNELEGAIAGGILISLASTLNYFLYGRIEGLHGIFESTFVRQKRGEGDSDYLWKLSFLFGIMTLPFFLLMGVFGLDRSMTLFGQNYDVYNSNVSTLQHLSTMGWILSGFLIGLGCKMTHGLAGGHAYCAAPVRQKRSIYASLATIASGFFVATLRYNFPFLV